MPNKLIEQLALVAGITPSVAAIGDHTTDVLDMSRFRHALFVLLVGEYGASGATLNLQLFASATNAASGGTAIPGKIFSSATFSGSAAGTGKGGLLEVTAEEVEKALPGARYVYGVATVATGTVAFSIAVLAGGLRYGPATDYDLASVVEIVS